MHVFKDLQLVDNHNMPGSVGLLRMVVSQSLNSFIFLDDVLIKILGFGLI